MDLIQGDELINFRQISDKFRSSFRTKFRRTKRKKA